MYIQDKVEQYSDEVFERLDGGAHIYFCGLKASVYVRAVYLVWRVRLYHACACMIVSWRRCFDALIRFFCLKFGRKCRAGGRRGAKQRCTSTWDRKQEHSVFCGAGAL